MRPGPTAPGERARGGLQQASVRNTGAGRSLQRVNTHHQARSTLAATAQSRQSLVRGRASPQMPGQQGTIGTLDMQLEHRSSWEVGGGGDDEDEGKARRPIKAIIVSVGRDVRSVNRPCSWLPGLGESGVQTRFVSAFLSRPPLLPMSWTLWYFVQAERNSYIARGSLITPLPPSAPSPFQPSPPAAPQTPPSNSVTLPRQPTAALTEAKRRPVVSVELNQQRLPSPARYIMPSSRT